MATSNGAVCEICDAQLITKSANYWCPECKEGLCSDCEKHHSLSKGTRKHEIISIENYLNLPSAISKISTYCNEHNLEYQNYCPHHNNVCCPVCISTHHESCCGLMSLQEVVKTSKTSAWLENIEQSLMNMSFDYDNILEDRKRNLVTIETQRKQFHAEIKLIREKISSHLDTLEQQIVLELDASEQEVKLKLETLLLELPKKIKTVQNLHLDTTAIKEYASDLQIFLFTKSLQGEVEKEQNFLTSLFDDNSLQQHRLICSINENISVKLTDIAAFGSVFVETIQPSIVMKTEKKKEDQTLSPTQHRSTSTDYNRISLKSKSFVSSIQPFYLRSFSVSAYGTIVCTDFSGKLRVLNSNGDFDLLAIRKSSLSYCDVTFIDNTTFAASADTKVHIINIYDKTVVRELNIYGRCDGLQYYNGRLLCNVLYVGIREIQLSNGFITDVVKQSNLTNRSYIVIQDERIYQTHDNNSVRCFSREGQKLWEFSFKSSGKRAHGIAVDKRGNVYIIFYNTNYLAMLSPDGQCCRHMKINHINEPWSIHFDTNKNSLAVASMDGIILFYDILYAN